MVTVSHASLAILARYHRHDGWTDWEGDSSCPEAPWEAPMDRARVRRVVVWDPLVVQEAADTRRVVIVLLY
jgi:hypothetical protein